MHARARMLFMPVLLTSGLSGSGENCSKLSDVAAQATEVEDQSNVCLSGFGYFFLVLNFKICSVSVAPEMGPG